MSNTDFYKLPTLTSIRLLRIIWVDVPEDPANEPSLLFSVQTFELNECPDFVALSYTWTEPMRSDLNSTEDDSAFTDCDQSVETFISQVGVPADQVQEGAETKNTTDRTIRELERRNYGGTKNLRAALIHLHLAGLGDQWFWVDAICIDQDNHHEKEIQVAMMGEIYAKAIAVVVWLGADITDFEEFAWLHEEFVPAFTKWFDQHGAEGLQGLDPRDPSFVEQLGLEPPGAGWAACWEKYFDFLRRRRWFSRAWIVQEVTLARHVVVQCGRKLISWKSMLELGDILRVLGWQTVLSRTIITGFGRAMGDEVIRLAEIRDQIDSEALIDRPPELNSVARERSTNSDLQKNWWARFQNLIYLTRVYSATDPRDKVYSTIGMLKKRLPPGMSMPIVPDYSTQSTASALFTSIASTLLKEVPELQTLSLVQDFATNKVSDLPSWVPDLTVNIGPVPLVFLRQGEHAFNCGLQRPSGAQSLCRTQGNRLFVEGAEIDRIITTCPPMWDVIKSQVIEECLHICEHLSPAYLESHSGPAEVLWRTMTANTQYGTRAPQTLAGSFRSWVSMRVGLHQTVSVLERVGRGVSTSPQELAADALRDHAILSKLREQDVVPPDESSLPSIVEILDTAAIMTSVWQKKMISEQHAGGSLNGLLTTEELEMQLEVKASDFKQAMAPVIPFRRLYKTEQGYLGLGPASAEVGDCVWLLQGARVPFILREKGDRRFGLIGETYLHGFMEGEEVTKGSINVMSEIVIS